jgi:hypothetical protein
MGDLEPGASTTAIVFPRPNSDETSEIKKPHRRGSYETPTF